MTVSARRMEEGDRAGVVSDFLGGDDRPLRSSASSVHVVEEDGVIEGVAVGFRPTDTSSPAHWGDIQLRDPSRMDHFVKLLLAKVQDAVDAGFREGFTRTRRRNLIPIGEEYFGVRAVPIGFEPVTVGGVEREPAAVEWEFRTELIPFLERLKELDQAF